MCRNAMIAGFCAALLAGCAANPCYPPSHYAAPEGAPYRAEELRIATEEGHSLAGTLTTPSDREPPFPALVLITGSSPQSRDMTSNRRKPASNYRPFRQIADDLSRRGFAVLRLDDRGEGCSAGGPLREVALPRRADDTRAGLKLLRARPDIDPQRLGLLGISEGANIAVVIAASDPSIRAVVALGATAAPGWQVIRFQNWEGVRNDVLSNEERAQLAAGKEPAAIVAQRMVAFRKKLTDGKLSPWWEHFLDFDPRSVAPGVSAAVLIVHGDRDSNVPVAHAERLATAIRSGGNEDVTVEVLVDHNHLLLEDADGFWGRYGELLAHTHQLPDGVLALISDWLSGKLGAAGGGS